MQKREGGRDCGVFAIATITAIAHGYDPTKMKFDQMAIRNQFYRKMHVNVPISVACQSLCVTIIIQCMYV